MDQRLFNGISVLVDFAKKEAHKLKQEKVFITLFWYFVEDMCFNLDIKDGRVFLSWGRNMGHVFSHSSYKLHVNKFSLKDAILYEINDMCSYKKALLVLTVIVCFVI